MAVKTEDVEPAEPTVQHFTLVKGDKGGLRFHLARLVPLSSQPAPGRVTVKSESARSRAAKREEEEDARMDVDGADGADDDELKRSIDPATWPQPVKLNRRNELRMRREAEAAAASAASTVKNEDGAGPVAGPSTEPAKPAFVPGRRGRFGKDPKSRQVYETEIDVAQRRVAREERDPWLLEAGSERWLGRLEGNADVTTARIGASLGTGDSKTSYVYFVMDEADFKVYPVDRSYRFVERVSVRPTITADEAEAEYQKLQTTKMPDRWAAHSAAVKREAGEDPSAALARPSGSSRSMGRGLRGLPSPKSAKPRMGRLSAVDNGGRRQGSDDERGGRPEVEEYDEMDYEDEFQDDEEGANNVADDVNDAEETKQAEAAIKRDQLTSIRGGEELDIDDDEEEDKLDAAGRRQRRLLRKHEQGEGYESDDAVSNPYASDRDDVSDDEAPNSASKPSRSGSRPPGRPSAADVAKRATGSTSGSSRKQRKSGKRKAGDDVPNANGKRARTASLPPVSPAASSPGSPSAGSPSAAPTPVAQLPLPAGVEDAIVAFLRANGPQPTVKVLKHLKAKVFKGGDLKPFSDAIRSSLSAIADSADGVFSLKADLR